MGKKIVSLHYVVQRETVRDERPRINAPSGDHLHQPPHPLLAARTQSGDDPIVAKAGGKGIQWYGQIARIDAQRR